MESIEEKNIALAEFEGYRLHTQVHLQDWDTFRGEPDPIDKIADVVSLHEVLQYRDNEAPEHWRLPKVVAEYETEVIPVADLDYHTNWNSLHRIAKKIRDRFNVDPNNQRALEYRPLFYIGLFTPIEEVHEALYTFTQFIKTQHGT